MHPLSYDPPMVGSRLKNILQREGVSAYRIWKDLRIDKSQLSRFMAGKGRLSLRKVEMIADHLGYDIEFVKRGVPKKGGHSGNNIQATRNKILVDSVLPKRKSLQRVVKKREEGSSETTSEDAGG